MQCRRLHRSEGEGGGVRVEGEKKKGREGQREGKEGGQSISGADLL